MTVLLITNTEDLTADYVVRRLVQGGHRFWRLNTDEFPAHVRASAWFESDGDEVVRYSRTNRGDRVPFDEVGAVLYRRPVDPVPADTIADAGVRRFVRDESYDFLRGLWYNLDAHWVSRPVRYVEPSTNWCS